ncbi:hypothetical protein [Engelhardtia mirabilis]|uniref:Uncharacterized protein n=1 Tax=Engelhardtia mirabilis TaxID=2528011 RepID=A0A518BL89_9BACT|nr:hypothetical protein Pla133_28160 [Planctomycetes bacterium Pla133]QDV02054.1 hypothetical protein Pla86_28150 [Planctomycetes bacterium Pla86]
MRLVLIEWLDSFGCASRWSFIEEPESPPEPKVCRSVGWLAHDGETCKVILPHVAFDDGEPEQAMGDMTIPTCAVVRIVDLVEGAA